MCLCNVRHRHSYRNYNMAKQAHLYKPRYCKIRYDVKYGPIRIENVFCDVHVCPVFQNEGHINCYNSAAKCVHANHMRVNCPLIGQCESAYVSGFCS